MRLAAFPNPEFYKAQAMRLPTHEKPRWKQYRGSGKPHGPIPRPNVKENKNNPSPSGPRPGNPNVREPRADEIPTGK